MPSILAEWDGWPTKILVTVVSLFSFAIIYESWLTVRISPDWLYAWL